MKSEQNKESLAHLRHSTAHLLAAAVLEFQPMAKRKRDTGSSKNQDTLELKDKPQRGIGPAIENGFYYEFDLLWPITEEDFPALEEKMAEILKTWSSTQREEVSVDEAKKRFQNEPYKLKLIEKFAKEGKKLTIYKNGNYEDLCKGGHVENPQKEIGAFKLLSIAGAYWLGDEKNKMLTRIYGTAFPTKQELDDYLAMREEAKKRDHRKLGKELDLFVFSDLVGSGLPLFTPRGTVIRDQLFNFSEELQKRYGYQKVWIPHITKVELYKTSGHWDKFGDELFLVESQETSDKFVLKPMNCPHHTQIYASKTRSYRDLPLRYMETTTQYRDEKAGELLGLSRVRSISIDDAHAFVRPDQVEQEFENIMSMIKEMYTTLDMKFKARLSFRDESDKYLGDQKHWDEAQRIIEDVAKKLDLDYVVEKGEAAFYGPKIDIMVYDALGREWQCATQQLDFVQPMRFGLKYIDSDGLEKTPFMIHKALLGSIERFLSVYIEHTAGAFPVWLAPVQVVLLPIADRHTEYAQKVLEELKEQGIRVTLDDRQERLQAKIRDHTLQKVPFMGIIGDKEVDDRRLAVRTRKGEDLGQVPIDQFLLTLQEYIDKKRI